MWAPSCGPSAASLQLRPARGHTRRLWCRGRRRRNPTEVRGGRAATRFQDDRRAAGAGAVQVQSVSTDVNQLSGHGVGPRVERLAHRLIAAAHRGHQQHGQYGVQQPAGAAARQLPADPQEHPDDEPQQDRRPHPAEHRVHGGGPAKCSKAGQPHERGRRSCPPFWSLNRTDSTANNAHPSANPSSTTPVRACSSAGTNGAATNTTATSSPTASDRATINPSLVWAVRGGGSGGWGSPCRTAASANVIPNLRSLPT
jgi:hypothetical protein